MTATRNEPRGETDHEQRRRLARERIYKARGELKITDPLDWFVLGLMAANRKLAAEISPETLGAANARKVAQIIRTAANLGGKEDAAPQALCLFKEALGVGANAPLIKGVTVRLEARRRERERYAAEMAAKLVGCSPAFIAHAKDQWEAKLREPANQTVKHAANEKRKAVTK